MEHDLEGTAGTCTLTYFPLLSFAPVLDNFEELWPRTNK